MVIDCNKWLCTVFIVIYGYEWVILVKWLCHLWVVMDGYWLLQVVMYCYLLYHEWLSDCWLLFIVMSGHYWLSMFMGGYRLLQMVMYSYSWLWVVRMLQVVMPWLSVVLCSYRLLQVVIYSYSCLSMDMSGCYEWLLLVIYCYGWLWL